MPAIRRYVVTEVREIEVVAEDPVDAVIKADSMFYPTAETLIENKGRRLQEPKVVSITAKDKH